MDDQPGARDAEAFATSQLGTVVHAAWLITGDAAKAEDLALAGMRRVLARQRYDTDDTARMTTALTRVARNSRPWPALPAWAPPRLGGLDLTDLRAEATEGGVEPRLAVREALSALTDRERTIVVLRLVGRLEPGAIARALWLRPSIVRRELDEALSFLAEVAGAGTADGEELVRAALADRPYPLERLERLRTKMATDVADHPPRPARRRPVVTGTAVAAAVVVAGTAAIWLDDPRDRHPTTPAGQESIEGADIALPDVPAGLKIVGFNEVTVTVPTSWLQAARACSRAHGTMVVYPVWGRPGPCDDVPGRTSLVSFGYASELTRPAVNRSVDEAGSDRVGVTGVRRDGGTYSQTAAMVDADVAVIVRSPHRRRLSAIISSVAPIPPGYTAVPDCLGSDSTKAAEVLQDRQLLPRVFANPSSSGLGIPLQVVVQYPPVGTVLPVGTTVNLGALPR